MKIAICDDNISDLSNIVSIVEDYILSNKNNFQIEYIAYKNPVDLIMVMESGQHFDLLLLDIFMPHMNGMEVAKEIRQYNQDVKIIFSTSSAEFAVESYTVDAFYYMLKPIQKENLITLFDKVVSETKLLSGTSILIKSKTGLTRIQTHRLEYAEVIGRTIFYHIYDNLVIESIGTMLELEDELLGNPCFIKPHRSYIVNMDYIDTLRNRELKMRSHTIIPMPKANYKYVKSAYLAYAFKESISINHFGVM